MQVLVTSSTDGGTTWSTPFPWAPKSDTHDQFFPGFNVGSTGNVGVTWLDRRNDTSNINYEAFATWSSDGGTSFKKNVLIASKPSKSIQRRVRQRVHGRLTAAMPGPERSCTRPGPTQRNGSYSQNEVGGLKR